MASDNASIPSVALTKRSFLRKHQHRSQSREKSGTTEFRINRTMTGTNRPSSKLSPISTNASIYPSTLEPMPFRRYHTQKKDPLAPLPSKLERQSTSIDCEVRLPVLYSLANDEDQKRMSDFRRRQIYALNHFMRDLEQEQFRQFCTTQENNTDGLPKTLEKNGESLP